MEGFSLGLGQYRTILYYQSNLINQRSQCDRPGHVREESEEHGQGDGGRRLQGQEDSFCTGTGQEHRR